MRTWIVMGILLGGFGAHATNNDIPMVICNADDNSFVLDIGHRLDSTPEGSCGQFQVSLTRMHGEHGQNVGTTTGTIEQACAWTPNDVYELIARGLNRNMTINLEGKKDDSQKVTDVAGTVTVNGQSTAVSCQVYSLL